MGQSLRSELGNVSEKIDTLMSSLFPRTQSPIDPATKEFENRYLAGIRVQFDRLRMIGVQSMRDVRQKTHIAFVSLTVRRGDKDDSESCTAEQALRRVSHMTIRGLAGSGKTTLMNWVALQCADLQTDSNAWRGGIPFVIALRNLIEVERGIPRIDKFVEYTLRPDQFAVSAPPSWIDDILREKRGVVLIDGVDELPASQRPAFWDWLTDFIQNYPGNRVYVSSRPYKEITNSAPRMWNPPPTFEECELNELDDAAIRELIENWHDAVDQENMDEQDRGTLLAEREKLPRRLKEPANRRVRELCRNPLLCSMVCALNWRQEGDLPQKRAELYEQCCDLLIDSRDRRRSIKVAEGNVAYLSKNDKELVLQRLAWDMMNNQVVTDVGQQIEISREDAESWVMLQVPRFEKLEAWKCTPSQVIDYLLDRTNLLREPARGRIDFPHRTFQEYLSACAAGALNQYGFLVNQAGNDQWHETIILSAGTRDGGVPFGKKLIESLLERGEASNDKQVRTVCFVLALACCDTARQVEPSVISRVLDHLGEIAPPSDMATASILATAGDSVLPYLKYSSVKKQSAKVVAACAQTLSLIASESAVKMLTDKKGYGGENRATVVNAICNCPNVHPLCLQHVRNQRSETAKNILMYALFYDSELISDDVAPFLSEIEHLQVEGSNISDISVVDKLKYLKYLFIQNTGVKNISPIGSLSKLSYLVLDRSPVSDLGVLAGLSHGLNTLSLSRLPVDNLVPIASLEQLEHLSIAEIRLRDSSILKSLKSVERLTLADVGMFDVAALAAMPSLQSLSLINAEISDVGPLSVLIGLRRLYLSSESISEVQALVALDNLSDLDIRYTKVVDVKCLASLGSLRRLFIPSSVKKETLDYLKDRLPECKIYPAVDE
jgi:hypothetical protein